MKLMLALFLVSGFSFAYTNSPAGNERIKDAVWYSNTDKRAPASVELKSPTPKKQSQKKSSDHKK